MIPNKTYKNLVLLFDYFASEVYKRLKQNLLKNYFTDFYIV